MSQLVPPPPWHLAGHAHLTIWRLDAQRLPALPEGVRPATVRGQALVVTAFVDYSEEGVLAYHELLAGVVARRGRGLALTITDIWVDDEVSQAGGRELWGIPKRLARFDLLVATDDDGPIGFAAFVPYRLVRSPTVRLPRLSGTVAQTLAGATVATPVRATGRARLERSEWTFPSTAALGWLRPATALVSLSVPRFQMTFGTDPG